MEIFVPLYALPEVLLHFVDTTATLSPCAQQKVGGAPVLWLTSHKPCGRLTFRAKPVNGDILMCLVGKRLLSVSIFCWKIWSRLLVLFQHGFVEPPCGKKQNDTNYISQENEVSFSRKIVFSFVYFDIQSYSENIWRLCCV